MNFVGTRELKRLPPDRLASFVEENASVLTEEETAAVLENPNVTSAIIAKIAQVPRLTGFYSVRTKLVAHRQTPLAHAVKLVHYLYWIDLVNLSVDVQVPAPVRRAVDTQLAIRVEKLTLGEKVTAARRCSHALISRLLFEPHPRVFEALLANVRLREDDLLLLASSDRATSEQLRMLGEDPKWSYRRAIRLALVLNAKTPRAVAASQLRHLSALDLRRLHANPETSVYVRRCIEALRPDDFSPAPEGIDYNSSPDA